jgi:hypothetical protein
MRLSRFDSEWAHQMIYAKLFKMETAGWPCDNSNCQHNSKYHDRIGNSFYLKTDKTCLAIYMHGSREVYCRDCIDIIYQRLKPILDSKLWIFK